MSLTTFSIEEKIEALRVAIVDAQQKNRPPGSAAQKRYDLLKSIAADLRGRQELPRNNTLGELSRLLVKIKETPREGRAGYDHGRMVALANAVIGRWTTISQALESYGEESQE
jgi:hypothetical protein